MGQLGEPTWFHTGDRDLAMHLLRSRLLAEGKTLSDATTVISEKLGVKARVLPMSDIARRNPRGYACGRVEF
jgi:LPPG:FO 2-phospho-L-lactate transferase